MRKHKQGNGFGLLEGILALGAVSALSLGIYMALKPTSASATAKREQDNLRELAVSVERSWGLLGSFDGLNASRVMDDGLAPKRMVSSSAMRTSWGTTVSVSPHSVNHANDGFVVVYPLTPSEVCSRLAAAVARDTFDIRVEGVSMFDNGQLNVNATAAACGQHDTATMEFVYHSGLVAGTAVATPPLTLPPASPSVTVPGSAPIGGPVGPVGPVTGATPVAPVTGAPVAPPAPVAPALPPAPAPVSPTTPPVTSVPAPSAPITGVTACVAPPTSWNYQNVNCAAGSYGTIAQSQSRTWSCPEAWDAPVPSAWSSWTTTSNTCTACPGSTTQTDTPRWLPTSTACPSGQVGTITWEYQQTRSRSVSYNCPAGTTSLPSPTYGTWSGWSNTGATRNVVNTCATACVAPAPEWRPAPYKGACPAGMTGTGSNWTTGERRTWTCPSPTDSPTNTGWVWDGTPGVFVDNGDCAANCVVPTPSTQTNVETRTGSQTLACPAGQSGAITQQRPEQRTQTRTASCPTTTGPVSWTAWTTWSAWTGTGAWTTVSNTCVATCSAPAPTSTAITRALADQTQNVGCPAGQTGEHWQRRSVTENGTRTTSWTCPGPTSSTSDAWGGGFTYGAWVTTSNTCVNANPTTCEATYAAVLAANNVWTRILSSWAPPTRGDFSGGFAPGQPTEVNGQCAATSVNGYVALWSKSDTTIIWSFYGSIGP